MAQPYNSSAPGAAVVPAPRSHRPWEPLPGSSARFPAEAPTRRILVVSPQPFYQDRGTPIAMRQVLLALSELGRQVDLRIGHDSFPPDFVGKRAAGPARFRLLRARGRP